MLRAKRTGGLSRSARQTEEESDMTRKRDRTYAREAKRRELYRGNEERTISSRGWRTIYFIEC